ncbi:MAG: hypothetical protein SGBAC_007293 [Bacillariaceae sp.]
MTSYTTKTNYLSAAPTFAYDEASMIEVSDFHSQSSSPQNSGPPAPRANMDQMLAKKYYETDLDITISGSRNPIQIPVCPHCSAEHVRTHTRTKPNAATWAGVGVGAVVFFPLCWVPLVMDGMKKTDHYCQNCHNKIGTVNPFEGFCVKEQV